MKNIFLCLTLVIAFLSNNSYAETKIGLGTKDDPFQISCPTCYADIEYKNIAKGDVRRNEANYYLIYNLNAQSVKTVFAFKFFEPEAGFNISNSRIITTKSEHQIDFDNYIDSIILGEEKRTIELEYPSTGSIGASGYLDFLNGLPALALQNWVQANSNLGLFTFRGVTHVDVVFANGDVATFAVTGYASAVNFPLLAVVDENGDLVAILGVGATISHEGGGLGTPGGSSTFTFPSGVTVCYGACPVRDGIIIIIPG